MIESDNFGYGLKDYLMGVERMEIVFRLNNITLNVRNVEVILNIEVMKKFQIYIILDTKCYNQTFEKDDRALDDEIFKITPD